MALSLCRRLLVAAAATGLLVAHVPASGAAGAGSHPLGSTAVRIRQIQGRGHLSPLQGQVVRGVPGIVIARRSNGFFMQDPSPDGDPGTAEGLFVFTGGPPGVAVGDQVSVRGTVAEFRGPGAGAVNNLTVTELTGPAVTVLSRGHPLPPPLVIGTGGRIPPSAVIDDDATGSVETSGTFDPHTDGIDFYESLEGMLVQIPDAAVVAPRHGRFGEVWVVGEGGARATGMTPRGGIGISPGDFNPERILLDDELLRAQGGAMPAVQVGDRFPGALTGVMDYAFGNFRVQLLAPPVPAPGGLEPETTAAPAPDQVAVATFNVRNLSPAAGPARFATLAALIARNLQAPDIVALVEVQDNSGPSNDGVVAAGQTYSLLIAAIAAAGGPAYDYRQIDPENNRDGGEPGGNIRVGFLFRTDRGLRFADRPGGTATAPTAVVSGPTGVELSFSPGRIDPGHPAWAGTRKPLAGEFLVRGRKLFVIANHFSSKRGDQPLFGVHQPPLRDSEARRGQQAQVVHDFVAQILARDPGARVVALGDFNDFQFSAAMAALRGSLLHAPIEALPPAERYSYVFEGNAQALDHIFVSRSLFANHALEYDIVHVNAEFLDQASDHDPALIRFASGTP